ncbi:MAG TPA: N-acetyltransferase [Treponemataceae bacterium]|jgi:predicted N-acetyltransferase YhbS|nr:MAG: N-acetyltransferase [Treponema sp.]HOC28740.1 N-acetyltransferase [Treponemataceae bacterium]HQL33176.1 N-acetyltransferase [Treponemataceae bacterium]
MEITIRLETQEDYRAVEEMTRDAFWNLYVPGCDEHYLCHIIRDHPDFVPELDFVAELDGVIVGSIMYTKAWLIGEDQERVEILAFGPLCVRPGYQRRGIGTALIEKTRTLAREMNIPAIVIYGDPHNYCKHGFKNGIDYRVSDMNGEHPAGLLVLELESGFFGRKNWKALQSDVFMFDQSAAAGFDSTFPPKEKKYQYSQELFSIACRSFLR